MKTIKSKKYIFLLLIFLIGVSLFSQKEGFYGYDQQWDSPIGRWTPCDINYYSIENPIDDNKCCSNISIWDPVVSLCHPKCDKGKIWNKKINRCVPKNMQCPSGYSMYKGNGKCGNPGFTDDVNSNF